MRKMIKNLFGLVLIATVFASCNGVNKPDDTIDDSNAKSLPYTETFSSDFGDFTTYDVTGEDQQWVIDFSTAKMTGYNSTTKVNYANEDWLISPEVSLKNVSAAHVAFDYIARYFDDVNNDITFWVSTDYVDGDPSAATWTQLSSSLNEASDWSTFDSIQVSLTAYVGQIVRVAVKYISTASKAGTIEIKNFTFSEGEASNGNNNSEATGTGTESDPYNVTAAIANQTDYAWVEGYIVGQVDTSYTAVFASPFNSPYNLLIADNASETNKTNCVCVQLPAGAVRTGLNLVDNSTVLGKKVKLYGSLESYNGLAGVKSTAYYEFEDGTHGGTKPVAGGYFNAAMTSQGDFDQFSAYSVSGDQVWSYDASYKNAKITGYENNADYANEDWLVTPAIDLSSATAPALTFDETGKYFGTMSDEATVWVSTDYSGSGDVSAANWTQIAIPTYMSNNDWTFVNSGSMDLSAYAGSSAVYVAFKYTSSTSNAGTWEIKNILIAEK